MMDFHAHLDLFDDPRRLIREVDQLGIYVLSVTTTPSAFLGTRRLALGCRRIRTSLGLHPQLAAERLHELPLFDRLIGETDYVGEIGLDGSAEYKSTLHAQRKAFKHVLRTSENAGGRVLSIHSRGASLEVIETLKATTVLCTPILHWFTGLPRELSAAVDAGFWFSVGPAMLKSAGSRDKLSLIPRTKILLESDGPFARYDGQILSPRDTQLAIPTLSKIWGCDDDEVVDQLHTNLAQIGLKAKQGRQAA